MSWIVWGLLCIDVLHWQNGSCTANRSLFGLAVGFRSTEIPLEYENHRDDRHAQKNDHKAHQQGIYINTKCGTAGHDPNKEHYWSAQKGK